MAPCGAIGAFLAALIWGPRAMGDRHRIIRIDGRTAFVYSPKAFKAVDRATDAAAALTAAPSAAVLVLHGSGQAAEEMFSTGFEPVADERGFLVVYPEMKEPYGYEWDYDHDVDFMAKLAAVLKDPNGTWGVRDVYMCGHSAGGSFTFFAQNARPESFAGIGAISAGVGYLDRWDMSHPAAPTMLIWNHADPELEQWGGEELYWQTVETVRRNRTSPPTRTPLPVAGEVREAELLDYRDPGHAPFRVLGWLSQPGTHSIPRRPKATFEAAEVLADFWGLGASSDVNV